MHSISKWCIPSHKPKYVFSWKYFQVLFTLLILIAVLLICQEKTKNDGAIWRNMLFMDLVWDSFPFYLRTVQSQTGTKVTRVGSATHTKSDWSEFIFRPVPCECMKRNVWRGIMNSIYQSQFILVSCNHPLSHLFDLSASNVLISIMNVHVTYTM